MSTLTTFRQLCALASEEERQFARMATAYGKHPTDTEREADHKYRKVRREAQTALDTLNSAVDESFPAFFPAIDPKRQFNAAMSARGRMFTAIYRTNHPDMAGG